MMKWPFSLHLKQGPLGPPLPGVLLFLGLSPVKRSSDIFRASTSATTFSSSATVGLLATAGFISNSFVLISLLVHELMILVAFRSSGVIESTSASCPAFVRLTICSDIVWPSFWFIVRNSTLLLMRGYNFMNCCSTVSKAVLMSAAPVKSTFSLISSSNTDLRKAIWDFMSVAPKDDAVCQSSNRSLQCLNSVGFIDLERVSGFKLSTDLAVTLLAAPPPLSPTPSVLCFSAFQMFDALVYSVVACSYMSKQSACALENTGSSSSKSTAEKAASNCTHALSYLL